ncbi:MAG: right-handed parallel beta-helix repeat-containing protein [Micromonosporaceae bacterium]|nr:right-handed parallel beta-helix repeat-containing protein [Micromonosporaceae bacterium]
MAVDHYPVVARARRPLGLFAVAVIGMAAVAVSACTSAGRHDPAQEASGQGSSGSPIPSRPSTGGPAASQSAAAAHQHNCGSRLSECGFPDATTTGVPAGTPLTVVVGNVTVTTAGAVIDGQDIQGCVAVEAPNVTIRRSKITCREFWAVRSFADTYTGGGLLLEDVEIDCGKSNSTAVGSYGFVARRVNVHDCENGFDIGNTATVVDSYIHSPFEGVDGHTDGIQLSGGAHITISHNTILNPGGTSAIISHPANNSDVVISNNLLAGGAYTLYCPEETSERFRVFDNRFGTTYSKTSGVFGPWVYCDKVAESQGNVWDSTLDPL